MIQSAQGRFAIALGVSRMTRTETVIKMLENNARRAPGYWLQLVLATGIATLGLVLGSTAVVIGGMLVSPLMGPLVELGMGFAVGSSALVFRAFVRTLLSVIAVIASAALLTMALPFHEMTAEIATRTAPTLLDLLVAVFCALAAAYTTVRQTADTTAAAAGTAIGIALVPPLCVAGFGIGSGAPTVAGGASLLFTANFSAILLLAVVSFLLLGFNQVDAAKLEAQILESASTRSERIADRMQLALKRAFGSRFGLATRLLVPLLFLAAVAVPLKRALDEVAWEVRARDSVRRALSAEGVRAVQSALDVERHTITLRLVVIGAPDTAVALERRLTAQIQQSSDVAPSVAVSAVPDAAALATTLAVARRTSAVAAIADLAEAERLLSSALDAAWPTAAAGVLVGWSLEISRRGSPTLRTRHLGPALGPAAEQMLARALAPTLRSAPIVIDAPLPLQPILATSEADSLWSGNARAVLAQVRASDSTVACVTRPPPATGSRLRERQTNIALKNIEKELMSTSAGATGRVGISDGEAWSIRVARGSCIPANAPSSATPASTDSVAASVRKLF